MSNAKQTGKTSRVAMFEIVKGTTGKRAGRKLYSQVRAHQIVARAKRLGCVTDYYVAVFGRVSV